MKWIFLAIAVGLVAIMFRRKQPAAGSWHDYDDAGEGENDDFAPAMVVDDSPIVKTVNDILRGAKEREVSAIHIDVLEREDGTSNFAARYMRGDEVIHTLPLQIEERDKIARRLKVISGIDPFPSPKPEEGRIKLKFGTNIQEFIVEFYPEEAGGEIILTVQETTDSHGESA
jgi:type IV pilus assembly protein PilB